MGVQSRQRKLQHRRREMEKAGNSAAPPISPAEQKDRYFANWVDGHPRPAYRQTNTGGHQGPKTHAPPRPPRFVQDRPFIAVPRLMANVLAGWYHHLRATGGKVRSHAAAKRKR